MLNKPMKLLATTLGLMTLMAVASACSQRNDTINRVVDPYWEKEYFSPDDTWYYRMTVIDGAPGAGMWGAIGEGHWLLLERLRWEITETALIGWRDYEAAPGTEEQQWDQGDELYKGAAVAIFPIVDHFDIVRDYNPGTGEQGNVISENRFDRNWYERAYMRVDWSVNRADFRDFNLFRIPITQMADSFVVQPNDVGDAKRFRFEEDYFETTTRSQFWPDLYGVFGFYGEGYLFDTAPQMIDFRHSFKKRTEANDQHEIVHMPPSVVLTDENGTELLDEQGFSRRENIRDRFGIYSTFGRQAWDPNRGFNDPNAQWHGTVFNIWEESKNADGSVIPMEERTPKPIVYYTNVTHPKQLLPGSINRVGGEWNKVFQNTVFNAQAGRYDSMDDVPDMFIVRENDCNPANVDAILGDLRSDLVTSITDAAAELEFDGTIASVVEDYEWANSYDNEDPFTKRQQLETQALENLERICSALEYYTNPLNSSDSSITAFQYQRTGDVRYNMLNLVMQDHHAGWSGYGPMLGDPVTGETIQATANIAMVYIDSRAAASVQQIDETNGLTDFTDLVFGFDIQRYIAEKLDEGQQLTAYRPSAELIANMDRRFEGLRNGRNNDDVMRESSPNEMQSRINRVIGTPAEQLLVGNEDFVRMEAQGLPLDSSGSLDEAIMDNLSPVRATAQRMRPDQKRDRLVRQGHFAMDGLELLDQFTIGITSEYADIADQRLRFEAIREELYVSVQLHEVGHNVGLFHNFEATSDALNYGERFWELQALNPDMAQAAAESDDAEVAEKLQACIANEDALNARYNTTISFTTQECLRQTEEMHSSVMDYHGTWNGRFGGLGPYDQAAISFAYGKLVEVFNDDALAMDPRDTDIGKWTYYNDWRDIAGTVAVDHANVNNRSWVKYEWGPATTKMETPANAVPYRFNGGFFNTPWAQPFDTGPDQQTQAALSMTRYYQYYFWSHFARNRLLDPNDAINRALGNDSNVMFSFTEKMQWYYFLKATDPDFEGSFAEKDFLATTIMGLNHFQHVLGHPRSGRFVNVDNYSTSYFIEEDLADIDRLAPSNIMRQWSALGQCQSRTLAGNDGAAPTPGHRATQLDLGDGRPFFFGLTEDYEDFYVTYVGTYFTKSTAIQLLGYNFAFFPRTTYNLDPRVFNISWYRLFPDEVGNLVHDLVADRYQDIGPVVDAEGNYQARNILDPETGLPAEYPGAMKILPTISFQHQVQAAIYSMAWMSTPWDDEIDMTKNYKIAIQGAEDDFGDFDRMRDEAIAAGLDPDEAVAEFTHPVSGQSMRGLKIGENSVAHTLVSRMNLLKERFLRLDACVNDPEGLALTDEYCACVSTLVAETDANGDVARFCSVSPNGAVRTDVPGPAFYEAPGTGECAFTDLEDRRENALQLMNDNVDFANNLRQFYQIFTEL